METEFPLMLSGKYGGFAIGPGWWPLVEELCRTIQSHIDNTNKRRESLLVKNEFNQKIPDAISQVVVEQIKEKFGGLRFYYNGGDDFIHGAVWLAEGLSTQICEECGVPGERRNEGWVRTLCNVHHTEQELRRREQMKIGGFEE